MPRKTINAKVDGAAHSAWHGFASAHGCTVTALLEVLGPHLDEVFDRKVLDRLLPEARSVTHERRRAGGPKPKGKRRA